MREITKNSLAHFVILALTMTATATVAAGDSTSYVCNPYPGLFCGGGDDKDDTSFTIKMPLVQCDKDTALSKSSGWLDMNASFVVDISVHWVEDIEADTSNITTFDGFRNTTSLVPNVRPDNDRYVHLSVNFSSGTVNYSNATLQRALSRNDDNITKSNFFTFNGSSLDLYHTYAKAGAYKPVSKVCKVDASGLSHVCLHSCGYENYLAEDYLALNETTVNTQDLVPYEYCDPTPLYIADDGTCSLQDHRNQPMSPDEPSSTLSGAWLRSPSFFGLCTVVAATFALGFLSL